MPNQALSLPSYFSLWAKTSENSAGASYHPLPYHLLDVAAVAERLLEANRFLPRFAEARGLDCDALRRFVLLLVALHDIGKASTIFQWTLPDAAERLANAGFGRPQPVISARHGAITACYLAAKGHWCAPFDAIFNQCAPGLPPSHIGHLVHPVAGHHGRPVKAVEIEGNMLRANAPFLAAAGALARDIASLLGARPLGGPLFRRDREAAAFSWFLSALIPVSDWIGSNQAWFPPRAPDLDVSAYWKNVARPAARRAIAGAGLVPAPTSVPGAAVTLPPLVRPTPLQAFLLDAELPSGASLHIIEDATGSGKTEAALTLAHRLMRAGQADGFYFALPTTATADAMFHRLADGFERLFDPTPAIAPSLVRVHGRVRQGQLSEDAPVAAYCAAWIADDRRKAFMAQGGAGTIDQALLTILPAKYQSLRLFGLHGKILIVDEVHAFDSYVLKELCALLELHAMLGGSAILMSATLPLHMRAKLAKAFASGRAGAAPGAVALNSRAYPLVTRIADDNVSEQPLPLADRSVRTVAVERIGTIEEAERLALQRVREGCCVALIRSTVDSAIESYKRLVDELGDGVDLLHSRFLPEDRARIETDMLDRFGKHSTPEQRRGRILVATQVIEQSLDVDFDALLTDLAPIDLLIQRAGRLWRHARPQRPIRQCVLHVISPAPAMTDTAGWLDTTLKEAAWVYGDVARLWLSAEALFRQGAIAMASLAENDAMPAHARRLVDAVYAATADDLPTASLRDALGKAEGAGEGDASLADFAVLKASDGYGGSTRQWEADNVVATRLERPARCTVRLACRRPDGRLVPLAADGAWASSEISVTLAWAGTLAPPDTLENAAMLPAWTEADDGVRLISGVSAGQTFQSAGGGHSYSRAVGLTRIEPT